MRVVLKAISLSLTQKSDRLLEGVMISAGVARSLTPIAEQKKGQFVVKTCRRALFVMAVRYLRFPGFVFFNTLHRLVLS